MSPAPQAITSSIPAHEPGASRSDAGNDDRSPSLERAAFGALVALLLSPILAQGLRRPLGHVFGPAGSAERVTAAALAIAAIIVLRAF